VFGTGKPPSYTETPTTREELEAKLASHPWDKLREFIDAIRPEDKLFEFRKVWGGASASGYVRRAADGTELQRLVYTIWMS
jgi:hypothetical protein